MCMTEKEEKVVDYMANLVGSSIEKLDNSAKDMIKFNMGIVTILTALGTFFEIQSIFLIVPIVLISIGLISFIITVQPIKLDYIVGEIDSSLSAYKRATSKKNISLKVGYIFTYLGFVWFLIVIIA